MISSKSSRILTILDPICRNARALSFLVWIGPALVVAICVVAAYQHWTLLRTKLFWLAAEHFVLLPILILMLIGACYRGYEQHGSKPGPFPRRAKLLPLLLFVVILFPLAYALDRGTYQGDENAYQFEARCLNAGAIYTTPPPQVPLKAITYDHHVILNGKWFGKYPAGWPLVLSLGTATNTAWFLNPLLGAALLMISFKIGTAMFGSETGLCSAYIFALSAFFSMNCLGFMSHVLCGLLIATAVLCYVEFSKSKTRPHSWLWIAAAFACLTGSTMVRPFTAMCAGGALIAVWTLRWKWSSIVRFLCWMTVWAVIVITSIGIQNRMVTGQYTRSPYNATGGRLREISLRPADLMESLTRITPRRLVDTGSTAFPYIFPLALYGLWRRRRERGAWALALVFVSLVVGHMVQTVDSDSPIGERYYFEGFFAVTLLAAVGWLQLIKDVRVTAAVRRNIVAAVCTVACAMTIMCAYWEIGLRWPSRQLVKAADHPPIRRGIVFVEGYDWIPPERLNFNTPGIEPLFLNDPGPSERAALAKMVGRPYWICLYYDPTKKAAAWSKPAGSTP